MFKKILIANRGEIACRVMQTSQSMGVVCVAVYSDADQSSKHVAMADQAVHIGGSAPSESYLRGDVIVQAALATGAEAIHPGYGFLSENPDFVEAVTAAGLIFIGPSSSAIRAMGLKDAAKRLMHSGGVPVVPGYHGDNQDPAFLAEQAEAVGYPVLIKAVAGGGGKGMRLVERLGDFSQALQSAQAEAQSGFGNAAVLIEKYIATPRHIEIQIFGDGQHALHLFERDCSLQRRHQKVIEEAPAPGMTLEMRNAMGQAAVRAAELIGYKGAGTVEFIVDATDGLRSDRFWFMEMNTRLQVEHPVTEAITGVDLVEWQLRVAAGAPLPASQESLRITGHAVEARLYAEDPANNFLPVTGRLSHLRLSHLARSDSGVRSGDDISPYYDPMIAKLVAHGPTRAAALERMSCALKDCEVAGTVTNLAFLGALIDHGEFVAGGVDTGLIARDQARLSPVSDPEIAAWLWAQAALVASGLMQGADWARGFTLWAPLRRRLELRLGAGTRQIMLEAHAADHYRLEVDGLAIEARQQGGHWRFDGHAAVRFSQIPGTVTLFTQYGVAFEIVDPLQCVQSTADTGSLIEAPMPGLVSGVFVEVGQTVARGDRLMVLEAMKMEHSLQANRDGMVAQVLVVSGQQVMSGDPLVQFADEGTEA